MSGHVRRAVSLLVGVGIVAVVCFEPASAVPPDRWESSVTHPVETYAICDGFAVTVESSVRIESRLVGPVARAGCCTVPLLR
jgi:hypothetical protein